LLVDSLVCGFFPSPPPPPPTERLKAGQVAGIVGLWADIDVAGPGHRAARRYPPDLAAARDLVTALPRPPSILVDSGHGLHAWWLVEGGPWMFADAAERAHAARVAAGWQLLLQAKAGHRGWDIDSTADLARVLRVPGTMNRKVPDTPVEVRVL
jgi:putative DNA primase/helicase